MSHENTQADNFGKKSNRVQDFLKKKKKILNRFKVLLAKFLTCGLFHDITRVIIITQDGNYFIRDFT